MNVQELMTRRVVTCRPDETLAVAAQRMWEADCGVIPVVESDGKLVGMLTDRDICMAGWMRGRTLDAIDIGEVMAKQVGFVRASQGLEAVARLMAELKVRRIPVVDAGETLLGIISISDIAPEAGRPGAKVERRAYDRSRTLAAMLQPRNDPALPLMFSSFS